MRGDEPKVVYKKERENTKIQKREEKNTKKIKKRKREWF